MNGKSQPPEKIPEGVVVIHSFPLWLPQTQTWMHQQVEHLPEGTDAHVVCDRTIHLDQFPVRNLHCLHTVSRLRFVWEKSLRRFILPQYRGYLVSVGRGIRSRILHSHFGPTGWMDMRAARQMDNRHIVSFYGYDVGMLPAADRRWLARYEQLFSRADIFLGEGPHMMKQLVRLGCPPEKIRIHHLGVDIQKIPFLPRQWVPGTPLRVLIAASFREKKGIPYALEALAGLQREVPLEITMIGDADGETRSQREKTRILATIDNGGLKSAVRLLGYQPYSRIFEEAYRHHIFISPSVTAADGDTEGGAPVSLIEMMATGMPVISTRHCDIPEVVRYEVDDWLAGERDSAGLLDRFHRLIRSPAGWASMVRSGRRHIEQEYNAAVQGGRLLDIYRQVLQ